MIKIFLVEDEYAIREGIKKSVDWESNGFVLVGEASDGEVALPGILREKPDILITDIRMPFMDGLELSRIVKKELPNIRIIVLSGYDDFNYAREAISIGIEEYILKPVSGDTLITKLKEIGESINSLREDIDIKKIDVAGVSGGSLYSFLKQGSASEIDDFVKSYFSGMGPGSMESAVLRQYVLVEALLSSVFFLESTGLGRDESVEILGELSDPVKYNESVARAEEYIKDLLKKVIEYRNGLSNQKYSDVIEKAKKYILDNYQNEDMSLQSVSAHVGVSSNHFSVIFGKETGVNFIDYLTDVRIDKAKDLLVSTSMKTSDVGFEVGYHDPHYFSYIFKKVVGMTPKDYRKSRNES